MIALLGSSYHVKVIGPNQQLRLMMRMNNITQTKLSKWSTQLRDVEPSHLDSCPIIWEVTKMQVESRSKLSAIQILGERNVEEILVHQIPLHHMLSIKTSSSKQVVNHLLHCCRDWSDKR